MKNIVLIGMPGAGKSTVGVVLAKNMGMSFMDSDLVIQEQEGKKLQELIEEHGMDGVSGNRSPRKCFAESKDSGDRDRGKRCLQ